MGADLMTPSQVSALLATDASGEEELRDEIRTRGTATRKAYVKGYLNAVRKTKQDIIDAAMTGSPYSLQKSLDFIEQIFDEILV